jgi:hypothetical protein
MGKSRGVYKIMMGNLRERDHLEDPGIDGRIILRCILKKWDGRALPGVIWLRIGTGGGNL